MRKTILILFFPCLIFSCSVNNSKPHMVNTSNEFSTDPAPFQVYSNSGQHTILAALESDSLFQKYHPFFANLGYEGNGYCWEGHIIQILEKKDPDLLKHLDFDPEAGAFYAYTDSKEAQIRFINLMAPIFSDLETLQQYVVSADRDRVDD